MVGAVGFGRRVAGDGCRGVAARTDGDARRRPVRCPADTPARLASGSSRSPVPPARTSPVKRCQRRLGALEVVDHARAVRIGRACPSSGVSKLPAAEPGPNTSVMPSAPAAAGSGPPRGSTRCGATTAEPAGGLLAVAVDAVELDLLRALASRPPLRLLARASPRPRHPLGLAHRTATCRARRTAAGSVRRGLGQDEQRQHDEEHEHDRRADVVDQDERLREHPAEDAAGLPRTASPRSGSAARRTGGTAPTP